MVEISKKSYSATMKTLIIGIIQKKLLIGIGWAQEARENLSIELDKIINNNKALEQAVKKKLHESYAHKFFAQREESIKQEKLASLTTLFMESVTKYKTQTLISMRNPRLNLRMQSKLLEFHSQRRKLKRKQKVMTLTNLYLSGSHRKQKRPGNNVQK